MSWIAATVACGCLLTSIFMILRTLADRIGMKAIYGPHRFEEQSVVTKLIGLRAGRIAWLRKQRLLLLAVGLGFLAAHFQGSERPWAELGSIWLPLLLLALGCIQVALQSRPAAILVLGASTTPAMNLQRTLAKKLFPHRPVSLLESTDRLESVRILPGDVFRITLGDWESAVWGFARSSLAIVIDVRQITPPVDRELHFLVEEDLTFKTVLLLPPGAPVPHPALASCRIVRSPEECVAVIDRAFSGYDTLPSDLKPIRDLSMAKRP